jgi:hypothetical protein
LEITPTEHVPDRRGKMRRGPHFFKPVFAAARHSKAKSPMRPISDSHGITLMSEQPTWLPLSLNDLESVDRIASIIHTKLAERPEVLAEKIELFPEGCRKLVFGGAMMGYGLSHPWKLFSAPALDKFFVSIPGNADCIQIHDIAVLPEARGLRSVAHYVALVRALASEMKLQKLACVSVYNTEALWSRYGFNVDARESVACKMIGYGPTAKYLIADV